MVYIIAGIIILLLYALAKRQKELEELRMKKKREIEAEQAAKQAAEEYKQQRYRAEQEEARRSIVKAVGDVDRIKLNLPVSLHNANLHLDRAEQEFREGAFAPFWDEIEMALRSLSEYRYEMDNLTSNINIYRGIVPKYNSKPPDIPNIEGIPTPDPTIGRMNAVVRQAQKDYHFASIYQQWRTNAILIAGFTSMGEALSQMGDAICRSINEMKHTYISAMANMKASMEASVHDITGVLASEMQDLKDQIQEDNEKSSKQQEAIAETLEEIRKK